MDKLRSWIEQILQKVPKTAPGAAMKYIVWYAVFLILCCFLDIIMLIADWSINGRPNLSEMRQFLSTLLSGSAIAAIGFVARWLVDSDANGVPDEAEKDNRPYPPYSPGKTDGKGDKK